MSTIHCIYCVKTVAIMTKNGYQWNMDWCHQIEGKYTIACMWYSRCQNILFAIWLVITITVSSFTSFNFTALPQTVLSFESSNSHLSVTHTIIAVECAKLAYLSCYLRMSFMPVFSVNTITFLLLEIVHLKVKWPTQNYKIRVSIWLRCANIHKNIPNIVM